MIESLSRGLEDNLKKEIACFRMQKEEIVSCAEDDVGFVSSSDECSRSIGALLGLDFTVRSIDSSLGMLKETFCCSELEDESFG